MPSDRFYEEIPVSHDVVSYVYLVTAAREVVPLVVVDGSVRVDRSGKIRRTCSAVCIDPENKVVPEDLSSSVAPNGAEILPYRGVKYADGTEETVPLGVFRIDSYDLSDTGSGGVEISIDGFDRSHSISQDKFTEPWVIEQGTNIVAAIKSLVERTIPEVEYDTVSSAVTLEATKLYDITDDPWEVVAELALSAGCAAYFDTSGRFVLAPSHIVDRPGSKFSYIEGNGCAMLEVSRGAQTGYNGVIVDAESIGDDSPPIRAVVWDDDPTSPTYYLGPYGKVPMSYTDRTVTTVEDAEAVGRQILQSLLGSTSEIEVTAIVNPALEAGDLVPVVRERAKVSGLFSAESFTIPFRGGRHSVSMKQRGEL